MPMIPGLDLTNVNAWGGESTHLPPGPYSFKIKAANIEAKSEGKNQLVLDNEVVSDGEMKGKIAKSFFMLDFTKETPKKRLKSLITATRIQLVNGTFATESLVGTQYDADVIHEDYESKTDPITGQAATKTAIRIVNEMPFGTNAAESGGKPAMSGNSSAPAMGMGAGMSGMAGLTPVE